MLSARQRFVHESYCMVNRMTHNNDELRCQIQCHVDQQDVRICAQHPIVDLNVCVLLAHWEVMDDHAQVINQVF